MHDEAPRPTPLGGRDSDRPGSTEADLVDWGKAVTLETTGRRTGRPRPVTLSFVEEPDGCLLVSADGEATHWARNLLAEPRCRVARGGRWTDHRAERLGGPDHAAAVAALILRYGTPAERLGAGPSFRLRPAARHARERTAP